MTLRLYYHPFASFCQKALIALYENGTKFEKELVDLGDPDSRAAFQKVWPFAKFPVLRDEARSVTVPESSVVIDYLQRHYPGPVRLIPEDPEVAMRAHVLDRVFDNYVATPLTKIVTDHFRAEGRRDPEGVEQARALIATSYKMLDDELTHGGEWAVGDALTLADCAAAPALFYSNIAVPFGEHRNLAAYYARLASRPSFARAVDEARPYRHVFPLEWPASYA
ncbi:MAG TPA: glutathione S-transferase family protein [Allosphingosinicella sp.]|uniref:glutathione S-transferase family protein n=1 Tax=Allosphingosinicella sp. TaxID=2823234 RepID=UPI002ED91988